MEQITLIVTYKAYVGKNDIKNLDRRKIESDLGSLFRGKFKNITVYPSPGNLDADAIDFSLDDVTAATELTLIAGWNDQ